MPAIYVENSNGEVERHSYEQIGWLNGWVFGAPGVHGADQSADAYPPGRVVRVYLGPEAMDRLNVEFGP